jgi:hypothetical protein
MRDSAWYGGLSGAGSLHDFAESRSLVAKSLQQGLAECVKSTFRSFIFGSESVSIGGIASHPVLRTCCM